MSLPLLHRVEEGGVAFLLTPLDQAEASPVGSDTSGSTSGSLIPTRLLEPGEQYRFHFDMRKCIGCKCCAVACNEQNGNPAAINWRRVGEIEGGWYPNTQRAYLSMGCNHCLEPSCLVGCPVDAYTKDPNNGVVIHSADQCIGCQYCTWNCSYGVPQYNPERGVVGKCDMCHSRLAEGREPACAAACPSGAIQIEIVNIAEWKQQYSGHANAPGLPSASDSLSTTRITLPDNLPPDTSKADSYRVRPEAPHWPLVMMTVLTQLSVGAFATLWFLQIFGSRVRLGVAALAAFAVGQLALGAATLHLGRPVHAYRAMRMWKRSWLSREVLMFALFSVIAGVYAGALWWKLAGSTALGGLTFVFGIGGVASSACIYLVRARPAWNSRYTVAEFYFTAAVLGPLFANCIGLGSDTWLAAAASIAATAQFFNQAAKFLWLTRSEAFELHNSARLLSTVLGQRFLLRLTLLIAGGVALPLATHGPVGACCAFATAFLSEILGRYLFFVSVVPKNMASSYLAAREHAA